MIIIPFIALLVFLIIWINAEIRFGILARVSATMMLMGVAFWSYNTYLGFFRYYDKEKVRFSMQNLARTLEGEHREEYLEVLREYRKNGHDTQYLLEESKRLSEKYKQPEKETEQGGASDR